jgi:hypothetical protein
MKSESCRQRLGGIIGSLAADVNPAFRTRRIKFRSISTAPGGEVPARGSRNPGEKGGRSPSRGAANKRRANQEWQKGSGRKYRKNHKSESNLVFKSTCIGGIRA